MDVAEEVKYRPFKRRRAYEHVLEQMKEQILTHRFQPGEKLPTEYDLCQSFGVSRAVIRQAMTVLSMMGLIEIKQGSGSFVAEPLGRLVSTSVDLNLSIEKDSPRDSIYRLIEMKEILESRASALAAERATPALLRKMENCLETMERLLDEPIAFLKVDYEFHQAVADATNNHFIESFERAILDLMWKVSPALVAPKKELSVSLEYHRAIYKAIQEKDPREAARAALVHLKRIEKREFSLWQERFSDLPAGEA